MNKEFSREEIISLFSSDEKLGSGAFGAVKVLNPFTLIKTYHSDIRGVELEDIPDKLIECRKLEEMRRLKSPNYLRREQRILKARKRLRDIDSSKLLIQGLAYYEGYAFGTLLWYYKQYETLSLVNQLNYSLEDKKIILKNLRECLIDMHEHYIYPVDIKEGNIMVRRNDLDVKLIDLEDQNVYYEDSLHERKRDSSLANFEKFEARILSRGK